MRRRAIAISVVGLAASVVPALAQTNGRYELVLVGEVTPTSPTLTVEVWAAWDDPQMNYLFGGGNYDLDASEVGWTGVQLVLGLTVPPVPPGPNRPGVINGASVQGAAIGQTLLPGFIGNPDNPILLATYEWTATDFTPRTIDFVTSNTNKFNVAAILTGAWTQLFPGHFSPGSAAYVIPAPSPLALLALGSIVAARRRRTRSTSDA